jgi:hypothetical protein
MLKDSSWVHKGLMTGWPHHSIPLELPRSFFKDKPGGRLNAEGLVYAKCQGRPAKPRQAQEAEEFVTILNLPQVRLFHPLECC